MRHQGAENSDGAFWDDALDKILDETFWREDGKSLPHMERLQVFFDEYARLGEERCRTDLDFTGIMRMNTNNVCFSLGLVTNNVCCVA